MAVKEKHTRGYTPHSRAEVHVSVDAVTAAGADKAKATEIHASGGEVIVDTHGAAHYDRDAFLTLMKRLEQARQVVA